jgi:hypothetical protein
LLVELEAVSSKAEAEAREDIVHQFRVNLPVAEHPQKVLYHLRMELIQLSLVQVVQAGQQAPAVTQHQVLTHNFIRSPQRAVAVAEAPDIQRQVQLAVLVVVVQ